MNEFKNKILLLFLVRNTPYQKGHTQSISESKEKIFQSNGIWKQEEVLPQSDKAEFNTELVRIDKE
jgi:hypothetical protein